MIYDCFTFFNELEMLEIRLNVLDDVVDRFVLVEMTKTHSGDDKKLYFKENKERFAKFKDKIIHIIVDDCPDTDDPWVRETYQRNCIARGLVQCCDEDIIIISDLDEIPKPEVISRLDCSKDIYQLEQKMYYYFINYLDVGNPLWLLGTKVLSYKNFLNGLDMIDVPYCTYLPECINHGTTASKIRVWRGAARVAEAGWHFSYAGDVDFIINKIKSFSHQEFNDDKYLNKRGLIEKIAKGADLFDRKGHAYMAIPLDKSFPRYILNNRNKYSHLIFSVSFIGRVKFYIKRALVATFDFVYKKYKLEDGRRRVFILGVKVFSYKRRKDHKTEGY